MSQAYIVRRKGYGGEDVSGLSGSTPLQVLLHLDDPSQARALGSTQLGVGPNEVDVIPWASNSDAAGLVSSLGGDPDAQVSNDEAN